MSPKPEPHEYPGLEAMARQLGDELKGRWPDVGAAVWLYHYGQGGGLAYVGTGNREDTIEMVVEWLARQPQQGHADVLKRAFEKHFKPGGK
jgi:hypothetical protein